MLRILDRYLFLEFTKVLVAILTTLTLVLSSLGFVRMLEQVSVGSINADVVLPLMGFQVLHYLARSMPPAFFLAILVVLGRMYRDSEVTALAACGVGPRRLYQGIVWFLVPMMGLTAWLSLDIQPWAGGRMANIMAAQREQAAELAGLRPGRFNEYSKGELVFYVESIKDQTELRNIFIQNRQHDKLGLITATSGNHQLDPETGDHLLILHDGQRFEGEPGKGQFSIAHFEAYHLRIADNPNQSRVTRGGTPTSALLHSSDVADRAELRERLVFPFSLIGLSLIAVPLSRSLPRQGLYSRMFFAFLVYFTYFNLHAVSVSWMKKQVTPEWLGVWWAQALLIGLAILTLSLDSAWFKRLIRRRSPAAKPEPAASPA